MWNRVSIKSDDNISFARVDGTVVASIFVVISISRLVYFFFSLWMDYSILLWPHRSFVLDGLSCDHNSYAKVALSKVYEAIY